MTDDTTIAPCRADIYAKGRIAAVLPHIGIGKTREVERRIKLVAERSGHPDTDWHFVGGRVVVKTLGKPAEVRELLDILYPEWTGGSA